MNNLQKQVKFQFLFLLLLLALYSVLGTEYLYAEDTIVAIVNNEIITNKDLNDFLQFMRMQLAAELKGEQLENKIQSMKVDLLNKLIEDRLILQKAKKNNLKPNEEMVKAKVDEIKKRYLSDQEFQKALSHQGLVQADIESRIREQLLMRSIIEIEVRSKVTINPAQVTEFYEKNSQEFNTPEEREFESISISDEGLAKQIHNKLENKEDINVLAKQYSLAVNKVNAFLGGELRKDIENVIFKQLKPGEVSLPLKIQESFYIFRLDKINPSRVQSLSEVRERISAYLFDMKMQEELTKWLDELKEQAYIKILTD
jgi:parvulin-like peptidyl-prolyl isomerase